MLEFKYGVAKTFLVPVIKAGATDFAASGDWTPATGDVKVSKNEAAFANIGTLPTAVGNQWKITLTAAELQTARLLIQIVDSATKAVEDQAIIIETYGHASAEHAFDRDAAKVTLAAVTHTGAVIPTVSTLTGHTAQTGDSFVRLGAPAGASVSADIAAVLAALLTSADIAAALEDAGLVLQTTTIATLTTQISWTLAAGSADNDAYNGCIIVIEDASTAVQKAIGLVDDYTGSTKRVFLQADPGIFTMEVGDKVRILSLAALEFAKAFHDRVLPGNHNINNSHGKIVLELKDAQLVRAGAFQAGSTTTELVLDSGASALDDFYNHRRIKIIDGPAAGQAPIIADYVGATRKATITPALITAAPDSGDEFEVLVAGLVHTETQAAGYTDDAVHVDTVDGVGGTLLDVNGTSDNPVSNMADAKIIAVAKKLSKFILSPDSSDTLASAFDEFSFEGFGSTIDLGGQSIAGSKFTGMNIQGIGTGTDQLFTRVKLVGLTTLSNPRFDECDLANNLVITSAVEVNMSRCINSSPTATVIDTGAAVGNVHLNMLVDGDFEIQNMGQVGTDTVQYIGLGTLTFNANCIGGTAVIYFNPTIVNDGAVTVTDNSTTRLLRDIQGAGFVTGTDSLKILSDLVNLIPTTTMRGTDGANTTTPPTSAAIAIAVLAKVVETNGSIDVERALRIILAACGGVTADGGLTFKDPSGTSTRLVAVVDVNQNRTSVDISGSA